MKELQSYIKNTNLIYINAKLQILLNDISLKSQICRFRFAENALIMARTKASEMEQDSAEENTPSGKNKKTQQRKRKSLSQTLDMAKKKKMNQVLYILKFSLV